MLREFLVDLAAIWAALYPRHHIRLSRLMLAASTGAIASGLTAILSPSEILSAILGAVIIPLLIYICIGIRLFSEIACTSANMLAVSALISGCRHFTGKASSFISIGSVLAAAVISAFLLSLQRRWLDTWEATIHIHDNDATVRVCALIDTGNRLTEPISGLPVMIVESETIRSLVPRSIDPDRIETLPTGFRLVPYGGVGGSGVLPCFMPQSLSTDSSTIRDIWVAVYPGRLPGKYHALAPAAIIGQISKTRNGGR